MSPVSPLRITRFAQLPRQSTEVWQGGLVRLPAWVDNGPDGRPYRPWAAIWISLRTGCVHMKMQPKGGDGRDPSLALETLLELGLNKKLAGYRPARLEVADEEVGAYLVRTLGDEQLTFTVSGNLPAVKQVLALYRESVGGAPPLPDALDVPGVTIEQMRAFGEAAKRFYLAAPWRYLSDEDLIHVETPAPARELQHVTVLGGAGQVFGLGFFETPEDFEAVHADPDPETFMRARARWAVWYGSIEEMSFGDADLWENHGLPVAADHAYPVALRVGPDTTVVRPDARILVYLEGLLLTLAETSEGEIDEGRWSRQIHSLDGPTTVTLCIPALLEPLDAPPQAQRGGIPDRRMMERVLAEMERFTARSEFNDLEEVNQAIQERFIGPFDAIPSTATTPLEKAQDLIYRAVEARGRRRTQLARKALNLSPDCADAYVTLAEQAASPEAACDLYAQGVAAGERALGPLTFEEDAGHFWGIVRTRPYMRARFGLAQCLKDLGQVDEAIGHYQALLRLNPNDNLGVRDVLLPALLAIGQDDEAGALLQQFGDDISAIWAYGRALWTFRREGDNRVARDRLRAAVRANRHVPKYLTGKAAWPGPLPESYGFGSDEEAAICAYDLGDAWRATPGAEEWLTASTPTRKPRTRRRR